MKKNKSNYKKRIGVTKIQKKDNCFEETSNVGSDEEQEDWTRMEKGQTPNEVTLVNETERECQRKTRIDEVTRSRSRGWGTNIVFKLWYLSHLRFFFFKRTTRNQNFRYEQFYKTFLSLSSFFNYGVGWNSAFWAFFLSLNGS